MLGFHKNEKFGNECKKLQGIIGATGLRSWFAIDKNA